MGRYSHLQMIGFVDDDPAKQNRRIAGYRVLGTSKDLSDVFREGNISDLIICARAIREEVVVKVRIASEAFGVRIHVIPSVDEILRADTIGTSGKAPGQPAVAH